MKTTSPTNSGLNTQSPAQSAIAILTALNMNHPCDMEVEDIAWARGLLVRDDQLTGSEGRLVRMGGKGIVTISDSLRESGRRRFTIAHEIGHFELHGSYDQLDICEKEDFSDQGLAKPHEQEANDFATELLMPTSLLKEKCHEIPPTWASVKDLAAEFQTSLTLTAIRLVSLSKNPCALICSEQGSIKWFRASSSFRYRLKVGTPLHPESYAYSFFQPPKVLLDFVPAKAWIKVQDLPVNTSIQEDCLHMPRYGTVLSLISLQNNPKPDLMTRELKTDAKPGMRGKVHIIIDGSWLYRTCSGLLASKTVYGRLNLNFTKLNNLISEIVSDRLSANYELGELWFSTAIFKTTQNGFLLPQGIKNSIQRKKAFLEKALHAGYSEELIFYPELTLSRQKNLKEGTYREKKVDSAISWAIGSCANKYKDSNDVIAIISGDGDLIAPIELSMRKYSSRILVVNTRPQADSEYTHTSYEYDHLKGAERIYLEEHVEEIMETRHSIVCKRCGLIFGSSAETEDRCRKCVLGIYEKFVLILTKVRKYLSELFG